jgi:hypothetical protein
MTLDSPSLEDLYHSATPCIVAFINKMQLGGASQKPLFPQIIGTGFFANSEGIAITNRHVVNAIEQLPVHPQTGERMAGGLVVLLDEDMNGCYIMSVSIISTSVLETFSSGQDWYGQKVPDIGFVQLRIRENPFLELAEEKFAVRPGMHVSTIGYPMGSLPLTIHEKVNQISPFIRRGIVSTVYPVPVANPHGFTIDIMQQGGSSGSPIFGPDNRRVVGLMWGGVMDYTKAIDVSDPQALKERDDLLCKSSTNISLAEPAYIVAKAFKSHPPQNPKTIASLPTLKELRAAQATPLSPTDFPWDVIPFDLT